MLTTNNNKTTTKDKKTMTNYRQQLSDIINVLNSNPPMNPVLVIDNGIGLDSDMYIVGDEGETIIQSDHIDDFLNCCAISVDENGYSFDDDNCDIDQYNSDVQYHIDNL